MTFLVILLCVNAHFLYVLCFFHPTPTPQVCQTACVFCHTMFNSAAKKPLKLSYLAKARIERQDKRIRRRARGGRGRNELLARIDRWEREKGGGGEEERQACEK